MHACILGATECAGLYICACSKPGCCRKGIWLKMVKMADVRAQISLYWVESIGMVVHLPLLSSLCSRKTQKDGMQKYDCWVSARARLHMPMQTGMETTTTTTITVLWLSEFCPGQPV